MAKAQDAEARGEKKTKRTDQVCLCAATCLHVCVYTCIHDVQESTFSKDRAAYSADCTMRREKGLLPQTVHDFLLLREAPGLN